MCIINEETCSAEMTKSMSVSESVKDFEESDDDDGEPKSGSIGTELKARISKRNSP